MRLRPVAGILLRQLYLFRSSPVRILPTFAWVGIDIVVWGFLSRYLNSVAGGEVNFVPSLLGAVLFWDFFTRIMQGVTTAFFEDIWSRNFLNLFATPLSIAEYVTGLILTSIVTSIAGLVVMLVLATLVFGLSFISLGAMLFPFVVVLFLFGVALGVAASAMVLRLGPASEWLVWPLPAMLSPFVGVYYPIGTLPAWMQAVGHVLPPSYVFEGMRALVKGEAFSPASLLLGAGLAIVQLLLAAWLFARVFRYSVQTGLLARYSAETVN
ncbi:MAG TPA: ABC transporter permease [Steroidobacteraceae bacterium]|nr:ABC transporter permease [Steroidobacteraceae bacterium]